MPASAWFQHQAFLTSAWTELSGACGFFSLLRVPDLGSVVTLVRFDEVPALSAVGRGSGVEPVAGRFGVDGAPLACHAEVLEEGTSRNEETLLFFECSCGTDWWIDWS